MIKTLSFAERRYLIIKHMKRGMSYNEACSLIQQERKTVRANYMNTKKESKKTCKAKAGHILDEALSVM